MKLKLQKGGTDFVVVVKCKPVTTLNFRIVLSTLVFVLG